MVYWTQWWSFALVKPSVSGMGQCFSSYDILIIVDTLPLKTLPRIEPLCKHGALYLTALSLNITPRVWKSREYSFNTWKIVVCICITCLHLSHIVWFYINVLKFAIERVWWNHYECVSLCFQTTFLIFLFEEVKPHVSCKKIVTEFLKITRDGIHGHVMQKGVEKKYRFHKAMQIEKLWRSKSKLYRLSINQLQ